MRNAGRILCAALLASVPAWAGDGHWRLAGSQPTSQPESWSGSEIRSSGTDGSARLAETSKPRNEQFVSEFTWSVPPPILIPGQTARITCSATTKRDDNPPGFPRLHAVRAWWHKGVLPRCGAANPDGTEAITKAQVGAIRGPTVKSDSQSGEWVIPGESAQPTIWMEVVVHGGGALCAYRHVYTYNWVAGPPPGRMSGSGTPTHVGAPAGTPQAECCGHRCDLRDALKALQMAVDKLPPEMCLDLDRSERVDSNDAWLIYRAY